jgi:hypothetical protein
VKTFSLLLATAFVSSFVFNSSCTASQAIEDNLAQRVLTFQTPQHLYDYSNHLATMVKEGRYKEALQAANVTFVHPDLATRLSLDIGKMEIYHFNSVWAQAKGHLSLGHENRGNEAIEHYLLAKDVIAVYEDFCATLLSCGDVVKSNILAHKAVLYDIAGEAWGCLEKNIHAGPENLRNANIFRNAKIQSIIRNANIQSIDFYKLAIEHANHNPVGIQELIENKYLEPIEKMHFALLEQYEKALQVQNKEERSNYLEIMSDQANYLMEVGSDFSERAQEIMKKYKPAQKQETIASSIDAEETQRLEEERIIKGMEKLAKEEEQKVILEGKNQTSKQRARENAEKQRASVMTGASSVTSQAVSSSCVPSDPNAEKAAKLERHAANSKKKAEDNTKKRSGK